MSYKVLTHGIFLICQGTNRLIRFIDLSCVATRCCSSLDKQHFLCSRKDTSREESSVNMKILFGLKDLHVELPGLTMLDFFLSISSIRRFGAYPVIHMQLGPLSQECKRITRLNPSDTKGFGTTSDTKEEGGGLLSHNSLDLGP